MKTDKEADEYMTEKFSDDPMDVFYFAFGCVRDSLTTVAPQMKFLLLDGSPESYSTFDWIK